MLSEPEDELLSNALAILSEHFPNYAVVVLSEEEGTLHYDYSNWRVGRMLLNDSLEDMNGYIGGEFEEIIWDEGEVDDE